MPYWVKLTLVSLAFTYLSRWIIYAHTNIKALNKEIEQLKKDK
jgi:hypothetical protein